MSGDSVILLMLATLLAKMNGTATWMKPLFSRTSESRSPEMSPRMIWSLRYFASSFESHILSPW